MHLLSAKRRLFISWAAVLFFGHPFITTAMDWENSAVIAEFRDNRHFHQDSERLVSILAEHKIKAVVTESSSPVISVFRDDEKQARKIMMAAIKKYKLYVSPIHEQS